ncbi:BMC domain-containing protein [Vallitalea okinawensis]|uniref:BMC domain-containing protein n=1 Tax=Vallitalea okinawensis TaxID=2078660 RepID=UPI000CFBBC1E|nr:BMC domain-containing protein [Vallitalea okinawensis]
MIRTIGLIELNSIAKGIEVADGMIKAASVDLLQSGTVCPGKYVILITGDVGDTKAAIEVGEEIGGPFVVNTLVLPSIHPDLISAINGATQVSQVNALGVLEFFSIATCIIAADEAAKAASVELIEVRLGFGIGGKAFITLTGDVSAVEASVEAGARVGQEGGMLVNQVVIPSPRKELFDKLL